MKSFFHALPALALLAIAGAPRTAAAQFVNPGFEATPLPFGTYGNYSGGADMVGWTAVGTVVTALSSSYSEVGAGVSGATLAFNSHSGGVSIDLTGPSNNGLTAGVEQSIFTIPGASYALSFWVGKATGDVYYATPSTVDLSIDGGARVSYTNSTYNPNVIDWQQFTAYFTATGSSTLVTFYNGTLDNAMVGLDDVSIEEVSTTPEPASLVLLGSGLLGIAGRGPPPASLNCGRGSLVT